MKKKILITGGSGYLGINLANRLKKKYQIFLGSRNNKNNFLAGQKTGCVTLPLDVSNINSVRDSINFSKPNIIIHAAATKFVDLSEKHPFECIDVNVNGSMNVARVAMEQKIETVIGISTDKASPPIKNIYGLSKSMMEKLFISSNNQSKTNFMCVRYGNVAWSTGSVLPIWLDMFKKNKTILTTGPYMRRFFFTVDDAVQLVENCINLRKKMSGKILSVEMKSSLIIDILNVWIKYFGGKYKIVSGREGDRLDEYLIGEDELKHTNKIKISGKTHYLIDFFSTNGNLKEIISSQNAKKLNNKEILQILKIGKNFEKKNY